MMRSLLMLRTWFSWRAVVRWLLLGPLAFALAWVIVHEVPGVGPWVADSLRSLVGVERVARLEDTVYGLRDSVNRTFRAGEAPRSYWQSPEAHAKRPLPQADQKAPDDASSSQPEAPGEPAIDPWIVPDVEPPFAEVTAAGDGAWIAVEHQHGQPKMLKTMLHPDPERSWAELFVVAIDVRRTELHWVPGTVEPRNEAADAVRAQRPGQIPRHADSELLAAFNGGFKTVHGEYGAATDGITLVPPRPHSCTIARLADGSLVVGTWKTLGQRQYQWLRQTPSCMVEDGKLHPGLARADNTNWGATLDGKTVIRRSALGLSADGRTLFVGISNDTTARALALGMRQAGANTVAQLDVNYSYPKFVLFTEAAAETTTKRPAPTLLVEGFVMRKAQYMQPEARDFFYLTRHLEMRADRKATADDAG